jgi:hypothetical protein
MRRTLHALLGIVAAAALGGCGGANIELDITASSGTVYPEAADGICAEVTRRFAQAQEETPRSFDQADELMSALVNVARQGEEALTALDAPPAQEDAFARYLAARADVIGLLEDGLAAARTGDGEAYQAARERVGKGAAERERLALAAGLRRCAAGERG